MSSNPALNSLLNPRPYPHASGGTPQGPKQPNRAHDELRNPKPYPSSSQPSPHQPTTGKPATRPTAQPARAPQSNPLDALRNPKPYPSSGQPQQNRPKTPQAQSRPNAPGGRQPPRSGQPSPSPSGKSQPGNVPQKKKPRVAVSMGAPKSMQPPRPMYRQPPPAMQTPINRPAPSQHHPQAPAPRTPTQPRQIPPQTDYDTHIHRTQPIHEPPISNTRPAPVQYAKPDKSKNGPPSSYFENPAFQSQPHARLTPTSGLDESDQPDSRPVSRASKRGYGDPDESDIESGAVSERTPSPPLHSEKEVRKIYRPIIQYIQLNSQSNYTIRISMSSELPHYYLLGYLLINYICRFIFQTITWPI